MKKVIIIGAGIGGLALANLLAKAGYQVTVYEKNAQPGGKAGRMDIDGFRFDTGPSWYLMPEVFEHYFELLGKVVGQELDLVRLTPGYKVTFANAHSVKITGDHKTDADTFESIQVGSAAKLATYLSQAAHTYKLATKYFLYNNFDALNVVNLEVLKAGPRMLSVAFKTMHQNTQKYFRSTELQQIMEYPAVFLGASPFNTPAIYSLMSHLDFTQGVFYPQGGLYEIVESMVRIGQDLGVEYVYDAPVQKIITKDGAATGIVVNGSTAEADIVVSNADLHFSETQLLEPKEQTFPEAYWQKREAGPSAILLYLGVKRTLPDFEHHNLFFADNWEASFRQIFTERSWPVPASMYVCVQSKTDPSVAPDGDENLFVLIPGPAVGELDDVSLEKLADGYIAQLAKISGIADLTNRITVRKVFGPSQFSESFNAWQGTALGLAHTLRQSALFRPQNKSKKVTGLYYVGGNTVPGIGIPMCLIGAELVYKRLLGDKSSGPVAEIRTL